MIISVTDARKYISTMDDDSVLEAKLQALEQSIRQYTNNNFQQRGYRIGADIISGELFAGGWLPFKAGDTIQISASVFNNGLYTVAAVTSEKITLKESIIDEEDVIVTKVVYPSDVVMGVLNMLKWDMENRAKVGIQSETISRHSVTYFNMDGENSVMGYPKSLLGFLTPYKKARF